MLRILVYVHHRIFREGLVRLLKDQDDFNVVASVCTHEEALTSLQDDWPDVVISELFASGPQELAQIAQMRAVKPDIRMLVLTAQSEDHQPALRVLRSGVDGYLTMDDSTEDVVAGLRQIHRGVRYISPAIAAGLAVSIASNGGSPAHECLSEREFQIFEMIVAGKRGAAIASELSLSEKTVSTHKAHVLRKLSAHSSSDLVRYAIRHKLVEM